MVHPQIRFILNKKPTVSKRFILSFSFHEKKSILNTFFVPTDFVYFRPFKLVLSHCFLIDFHIFFQITIKRALEEGPNILPEAGSFDNNPSWLHILVLSWFFYIQSTYFATMFPLLSLQYLAVWRQGLLYLRKYSGILGVFDLSAHTFWICKDFLRGFLARKSENWSR